VKFVNKIKTHILCSITVFGKLLIAQDYENLEYMTRKLIDEYELWGLKLNVKKTKYMAIGDTLRDLYLEDGKGTIINHVNE